MYKPSSHDDKQTRHFILQGSPNFSQWTSAKHLSLFCGCCKVIHVVLWLAEMRVTVNSSFTFHVAGALGTVLLWLTLTLDYFNILLDLSKMFYCVRSTLCKSLITFLCISWAVCLPGFLTHNSNNLCIIPPSYLVLCFLPDAEIFRFVHSSSKLANLPSIPLTHVVKVVLLYTYPRSVETPNVIFSSAISEFHDLRILHGVWKHYLSYTYIVSHTAFATLVLTSFEISQLYPLAFCLFN